MDTQQPKLGRRAALQFIVLLGVVSLLADVTYEGARSSTGPFLEYLQASAVVVGFAAGLGELMGYGVRLLFGVIADRTGRYWLLTILGYAVNLLAVPLLALAGAWPVAVALMIAERLGKGMRTPARDAMLSQATSQVGRGWGFALHEAMDQTGAVAGPLLMAAAVHARGDYRAGFALLAIPALLALAVLTVACVLFPRPEHFESHDEAGHREKHLPSVFWIYLVAMGLLAAGFADFPLVAYHLKRMAVTSDAGIPLLYALAMAVDALAALVLGRIYDRRGFGVLVVATVVSAAFAPLAFLGGPHLAIAGIVCWAVGMGAQESVVRAAVAGMVPSTRRASAYGTFNAVFGVAWFGGSALMGVLYEVSLMSLVVFSLAMQLGCAGVLLYLTRRKAPAGG